MCCGGEAAAAVESAEEMAKKKSIAMREQLDRVIVRHQGVMSHCGESQKWYQLADWDSFQLGT